MNDKVITIIPARLKSSRFPQKMLKKIAGKPLIQLTYENVAKAVDEIYVATDDKAIFDCVLNFGKPIMTSLACSNGTERVLEAFELLKSDADIILNVQGDHPCVKKETINAIINALKSSDAPVATAVSKIDISQATNPNVVKCVFDEQHNALYFSRSLIPYPRKEASFFYYHVGIYAYRAKFLAEYKKMKGQLALTEDLEQLKILENGHKIKVAIVDEIELGVDTSDDILKVERFLCKQSIFS